MVLFNCLPHTLVVLRMAENRKLCLISLAIVELMRNVCFEFQCQQHEYIMGKKYYCDYCDKSFADNPTNRKNHARGVHHRQARSAHYEHFKGNSCASVLSLFHVYTRDIVLNVSICLSVTLLCVKFLVERIHMLALARAIAMCSVRGASSTTSFQPCQCFTDAETQLREDASKRPCRTFLHSGKHCQAATSIWHATSYI